MPESGYRACACRDCFETAIGDYDDPTVLCLACEEAGCTPCDCENPDRGCPHGECCVEEDDDHA